MKKILFSTIVIIAIIYAMSCNKESTCECTTYTSDTLVTKTSIEGNFEKKVCEDSSHEIYDNNDSLISKKVCVVK